MNNEIRGDRQRNYLLVGQAITKRYLKAEALHAQQLMAWIHQLFNLEPMIT